MNREERRKQAAIEARATKPRSVVVYAESTSRVSVDTTLYEVDFNRSYTFEFEANGRFYRWTGARAQREDDLAIFDYQDGKNGVMTEIPAMGEG